MLVLTCVLMGFTASLWRRVTYEGETAAYCYQQEQLAAVLEGALAYGVHQLCEDRALQKIVMAQQVHLVDQTVWAPFSVQCQYEYVAPEVMTLTIVVFQSSNQKSNEQLNTRLQRVYLFDVDCHGNEIRQVRGRGEFFGVY
jgi:hypothetical protein